MSKSLKYQLQGYATEAIISFKIFFTSLNVYILSYHIHKCSYRGIFFKKKRMALVWYIAFQDFLIFPSLETLRHVGQICNVLSWDSDFGGYAFNVSLVWSYNFHVILWILFYGIFLS